MNKTAKTVLLVILAVLVIAAIGIQFVPVERANPPVTAALTADAAVVEVLRASCYDCHSHETVWPWYSRVAPVSWLVAADVEEARGKLNFSEWAQFTSETQADYAREILDEIEEGGMPLPKYLIMHPAAKLDETDRQLITQWANGLQLDYAPPETTPAETAPEVAAEDDATAGDAVPEDGASAEDSTMPEDEPGEDESAEDHDGD